MMGARIRARRDELGFSQDEVAVAIGRSRSLIAQYERGGCKPSAEALLRLADKLKLPIEEILGPSGMAELPKHTDDALRLIAIFRRLNPDDAATLLTLATRLDPGPKK